MMTDAEAQRENEASDIERDELRRRGLWQPGKPEARKPAHVYRPRTWTAEEIDKYS